MREQIKLILDTKNMKDVNEANKRMASLQRSGFEIVENVISEAEQSYYLEKIKESA